VSSLSLEWARLRTTPTHLSLTRAFGVLVFNKAGVVEGGDECAVIVPAHAWPIWAFAREAGNSGIQWLLVVVRVEREATMGRVFEI
jgi:hypothetical protein